MPIPSDVARGHWGHVHFILNYMFDKDLTVKMWNILIQEIFYTIVIAV